MRARHNKVMGSTAPISVQLTNLDSTTGTAPVDLTNCNSFTAKARRIDVRGGVTVTLTADPVDMPNGRVDLFGVFPEVGEYAVQVEFKDADDQLHIYPNDGRGLRVAVAERY
jgi:hypothetical protein